MSALRECYTAGCFEPLLCETIKIFPCAGLNDNGDAEFLDPFEVEVYAEGHVVTALQSGSNDQAFIVSFTEIRLDDLISHSECEDCKKCPSSIKVYCNPCTGEKHWEVTL